MKKIFLMFMLLALILSGCANATSTQREYKSGEEVIYQSNTSEIKLLEINRYDRLDGHLITKAAGVISFGGGGSQDGGFSANLMLEYDRGYATGTLDFLDDKVLDIDKVSSFLCADCMNEILPKRIEKSFGVGIINLGTKEVRLFEENMIGFDVGDFHIEWYPQVQSAGSSKVHLIVFYCPIRYSDGT